MMNSYPCADHDGAGGPRERTTSSARSTALRGANSGPCQSCRRSIYSTKRSQMISTSRISRTVPSTCSSHRRLTLHRSERHAAARQIVMLRALRSVSPAAHLSAKELAAALAPLAADKRSHSGGKFAEPAAAAALCEASGGGSVERLLELVCPMPRRHDRPEPRDAPPDAPHGQTQTPHLPPPPPFDTGRPACGPPFDRASGRKGQRHVPPPAAESIPLSIRYRFSQSAVAVPSDFEPRLVTRSAQPPDLSLRREIASGVRRAM